MRILAISLVVLLISCRSAPRATGGDRNVIRAAEIETVQAANAYDIVAKLRSEFLRSRGPTTVSRGRAMQPPAITVFVDGIEAGPIDRTLHQIPAIEVHEIRLYRAADAATKYGTRHGGGVIEVRTMRSRRP